MILAIAQRAPEELGARANANAARRRGHLRRNAIREDEPRDEAHGADDEE